MTEEVEAEISQLRYSLQLRHSLQLHYSLQLSYSLQLRHSRERGNPNRFCQ